jgi:hypothetical protein
MKINQKKSAPNHKAQQRRQLEIQKAKAHLASLESDNDDDDSYDLKRGLMRMSTMKSIIMIILLMTMKPVLI